MRMGTESGPAGPFFVPVRRVGSAVRGTRIFNPGQGCLFSDA